LTALTTKCTWPLLVHDYTTIFAICTCICTCSELAIQLAEQFRAFGAGMSLRDAVIIGGLDDQAQARELARRPHVVVATPGRLAALLEANAELSKGTLPAASAHLTNAPLMKQLRL
jgi:superfamily II DNA/RNA helicase